MAEFKYTVSDQDGAIISETVIAQNEEEVLFSLKRQKLTLVNIKEIEDAKVSTFDQIFNKVNTTDKAQFLEYFASMLEAGLTISDVLQAFYEDLDKPMLRKFVKDTRYGVQNGKQLSECFADYPDLFPALYVGMIKVGEASGTLALSLRQLANQIKKTNELRSKVRNAMIYPAVLVTALVLIIIVLMIFVFPQLETFFGDAGLDLPPLTQGLIGVSKAMSQLWYIEIPAIIGLSVLWRRLSKRKSFQSFKGKILLKTPIVGPISRNMNVALFARTFGSLLESGVNILQSVDVVKDSMTNQVYKDIMDVIKEDLTKGNTLADSMKKFPDYFAPFEVRVLFISDRTGETASGLKNIAEFYEAKIYDLLDGLSSAVEPALLIVMGGVVAVVALAVITPIYQLLSGVEGI